MRADETIRVDLPSVRRIGSQLTVIGGALIRDCDEATRSLSDESAPDWAVAAAADTLGKLWHGYLSSLGSAVSDHGSRLARIADAYQETDAKAAEAVGAVLPRDVGLRSGLTAR